MEKLHYKTNETKGKKIEQFSLHTARYVPPKKPMAKRSQTHKIFSIFYGSKELKTKTFINAE